MKELTIKKGTANSFQKQTVSMQKSKKVEPSGVVPPLIETYPE